MSRSTKKGPCVDPKLLKKVEAVGNSGQKTVTRPGPGIPQILPDGRAY
jgi:ribosomal protein S19